ncbi:MAG: sulfatase-like hydrolase/transferase, partial [Myxococcales bacterium]|nr:sulfatase-like hydrolase/transferase [Myxococcales bacterium]
MISIDALRADHMGLFGYDRDTTPVLDELASGAVAFTDTWSAAPRVLPAHCAILTGCDPNLARRFYRMESVAPEGSRFVISERMPHLAVSMLGAGFTTAAFLDDELLSPVTGLDAGFQRFEGKGEELPVGGAAGPDVGLPGVSRRFLDWARGLEQGQDWFAYLQVADLERVWRHRDPTWDGYFQPHPGMEDVPPISNDVEAFFAQPRTRWLGGAVSLGEYEARYDGRIRRLDLEFGAFLENLKRSGLFENTTICIVGSFGLQFGEAGLILDHGLYSRADLHVPWILKPAPGVDFDAGLVSSALASTLDLAPTLLELSGVPKASGMLGRSQVANLKARPDGPLVVRDHAFASCGYQEGGAVIAKDVALELTFPGQSLGAHETQLSRGWFGDEEPHFGEEDLRFFDPASGARVQPPAARRAELKQAAMQWFVHTQDARRALFGSVWRGDALSDERIAE